MDIVNQIEKEVKSAIEVYKNSADDNYDFWNEHIKYVYKEAVYLAKKYNANLEIVKLGALLHDIALIRKVGDRKDHHINGKILAEEILLKYSCPTDKMNKVLACVYNHRSSQNGTTIEELCVADADILAHFDNIPMLFNSAYNRCNINLSDVRTWMKETFDKDFNDLSDKTKETFKKRYNQICEIVIGN